MDPSKRRRRTPWDFDNFFNDEFFPGFNPEFQRRLHERIHRFMHDAATAKDFEVEPGKSYVYGFNMHTGPDGKPIFEEFGNIPSKGENNIPGEREPLVEVITKDDELTVIAELPGVEKEDIELDANELNLTIDVNTEQRKYHKKLKLPEEIDEESIKATYKNGILEVKLNRKKPQKQHKKKIKIE